MAKRLKQQRAQRGDEIIAEREFDLTSPVLDQEMEQFAIKAQGLLRKRGLTAFAATHKRDGHRLRVVLFPASLEKGAVSKSRARSDHDRSTAGVGDTVSKDVAPAPPRATTPAGLAKGLKPKGRSGLSLGPRGRPSR